MTKLAIGWRCRRLFFVAGLALLIVLSRSMAAQSVVADRLPKMPPPLLKEGRLVHGSINVVSGQLEASFQLRVDSSQYAVRLFVQNALADLDLQVIDRDGNLVWRAETPSFNEQLLLYRLGNPSLEDGSYTVKVAWLQDYRPSVHGEAVDKLDFEVGLEMVRAANPVPLAIGKALKDNLDKSGGMMRSFLINVPAGVTQLRVDAWSPGADIDLFAQTRQAFADPRQVELVSQSYRPRESLVIPIPSASTPTRVQVMVVSEPDEVPQGFQIEATAGIGVPADLLALPVFSAGGQGGADGLMDQALQATVEIISETGGGSACVISPEGWILTNCHVVQGGSGVMPERVSVGFSLNYRLPPDCQFWARVVASDRSRDLALLRIENGFYGQAIPAGYRFPSLVLRGGNGVRMGEALTVLGYPTIGGLGNRPTITLTDGRVSGFQDRGFGVLIKTAAEISAGNSGGAVLDGQGRLVGLPTMVAGDETSRLAYIFPVELLPTEWLKLAGLAVGTQAR